jgi:hypothetical protein
MRRVTLPLVAALALAAGCKNENEIRGAAGPGDELVAPPPCIEVEPATVDFGQVNVTVDPPKDAVVTVRNTCAGDLEIYGLELDDPAAPFTIGALGSILLPQGSTTDFTVTFDPRTSASWNSRVLIDNNDPEKPTATVDLIGEGVAPIIEVDPLDYDFGSPYIGCQLEQPFTIRNVGNADLTVTSVQFATGTVDFDFDSDQTVPFTVAPAAEVQVYVSYVGLDEFDDKAYLTIESNDPWTPEVVSSIVGDAVKYGDNLDVFEQPVKSETDILFVVDNSCSMAEEQASLTANFNAFIDTLVELDGDYQLGVITTDNPDFRGDIITSVTPDPADEFTTQALAGTSGSGDEKGLEMAWQSTQSGADAGPGGEFLRDGAMLAIVILTDEPDSSSSSGRSPADYVDYWVGIKDDDADLVRVHAIAGEVPTPSCGTASAGTGYDEAVALSGGEFVSICATDWGASLEAVALGSVTINDSFALTQLPVPQTIEVAVDGISSSVGWEYDAGTNSVVFESDFIPPGGSTVEIQYELMPDCEG